MSTINYLDWLRLFKPKFKGPLDVRSYFNSLQEALTYLTLYKNVSVYDGQLVSVGKNEEVKLYIVKSTVSDDAVTYYLDEVGSGGLTPEQLENLVTKDLIGTLLSFAGSFDSVLQLPVPVESLVGKTYNIRDPFVLEEPFYDTGGLLVFNEDGSIKTVLKKYPAGTNVVCYKFEYAKPKVDAEGNPVLDETTGEQIVDAYTSYRWDALGGVTDWDWEEVD